MSCEVSFCSRGGRRRGLLAAGEQGLAGGEHHLLVGEGLGEPGVRAVGARPRRLPDRGPARRGRRLRREKEKVSTSKPGTSVPAITRSGGSAVAAWSAWSTLGTTRTRHPSAPRAALDPFDVVRFLLDDEDGGHTDDSPEEDSKPF